MGESMVAIQVDKKADDEGPLVVVQLSLRSGPVVVIHDDGGFVRMTPEQALLLRDDLSRAVEMLRATTGPT